MAHLVAFMKHYQVQSATVKEVVRDPLLANYLNETREKTAWLAVVGDHSTVKGVYIRFQAVFCYNYVEWEPMSVAILLILKLL